MDGENPWHVRHLGDRNDVVGLEGDILGDRPEQRSAGIAEHQRMPVLGCRLDLQHGEGAPGAGAVLHDEGLAEVAVGKRHEGLQIAISATAGWLTASTVIGLSGNAATGDVARNTTNTPPVTTRTSDIAFS